MRIEPYDYVLAPTPPPDIDVEAWHASVATVRAWKPERLALTHFGSFDDPAASLDRLEAALDRWAARARELERDAFTSELAAEIDARTGTDAPAYRQSSVFEHHYDGLARYWAKRA